MAATKRKAPPKKTPYREAIERLADLASKIERGEYGYLPGGALPDIAKDIRKVLHGARG